VTRRTRTRLALLAVGFAAALLAAEVGARLFLGPPRLRNAIVLDPGLGFRAQAGALVSSFDARSAFTFRLNRLGFRGAEPPTGPSTGPRRLLFLGDSFLYADAVRDEEHLALACVQALAGHGLAAESFQLGCPGYSTAQELLLWRRHGPRAQPDDVILMVFAINDVPTNDLELAGRTRGNTDDYFRPYLDSRGRGPRYPYPARAFLRRHSMVFARLESSLLATAARRGWSWPEAPRESTELLRAARELLCAPEPDGPWERAWRHTEELLRVFRAEVEASGARFHVVLVPNAAQVEVRGDAPEDSAIDWSYPERRLGAFFEREGIPAVLLLEPLRAAIAADPDPLFASDDHFTARAHALTAHLLAENLLDPRPPATPAFTGPVDRRAAERRIPFLDLTSAPRLEFLGDGFGTWMPDWLGHGPGVPMASRARVFLRRGEGDLVVRGLLAGRAARRGAVLTLVSGRLPLRKSFALAEAGPFECHVPSNELAAEPGATFDVELVVAVPEADSELAWPVLLRAVGFEGAD
jgi:hypothetical protein